MMFILRSVIATAKAPITGKQCLSFEIFIKRLLNVRSMCCFETKREQSNLTVPEGTYGRMTLSTEISYYKNLMENNPRYPDFNISEKYFERNKQSTNKLVAFLRRNISEESQWLRTEIQKNLTLFEDDIYTLHDCTEIFYLLGNCSRSFINVKTEEFVLFDLLRKKCKDMEKTSNDLAAILTLLCIIKNTHFSTIGNPLMLYIASRYKRLTVTQLIEFFYMLCFFKHKHICDMKEMKYPFELFVCSKLHEFTLDELTLMCYGLFRTELKAGTLLNTSVCEKIIEVTEKLNNIQACAVSKYFQYSGRHTTAENLKKILETFVPIIDKFTIQTAVHIACAGINANVQNMELFKIVFERSKREFDDMRLKDLERLMFASIRGNFDLSGESDFKELVVGKFSKNKDEVENFPRSFLSLLTYLIVHNIYIDDLISFALSDKFIKVFGERFDVKKSHDLAFIDSCVELERPQYTGNVLPSKIRNTIRRKGFYSYYKNDGGETAGLVWRNNVRVTDMLKKIYRNGSCTLMRPLPMYVTFHPILCVNKSNEPQDIGNKIKITTTALVKAPKDGNLWISFLLLQPQGFLDDLVTLNFVTEAKLRHFRTAGYIPIPVYNLELHTKTDEELREFLTQVVKEKVQSLNHEK